jgi:hypothetical protein
MYFSMYYIYIYVIVPIHMVATNWPDALTTPIHETMDVTAALCFADTTNIAEVCRSLLILCKSRNGLQA